MRNGISGRVQIIVGVRAESGFRVEEVVNRGVDGGEFLQTSHAPEARDYRLPSLQRQVRVLRSIVQPASGFLPACC